MGRLGRMHKKCRQKKRTDSSGKEEKNNPKRTTQKEQLKMNNQKFRKEELKNLGKYEIVI